MNTKARVHFWDYLTPRGWKKIKEVRLDEATQLFVSTIEPHIGHGAVLLGQELRLLEKHEQTDDLTQCWLDITAVRRKNWKVEIFFDKRKSHLAVGNLVRSGPHTSSHTYRETAYSLKHEAIDVCITTDGELKFVKYGGKQSRLENFSGNNWGKDLLASPVLVAPLPEQTKLILEAIRLLSFIGSDQSLSEVFIV